YLVKKFHARGGLGEVWLALDPEIGRAVAVKRLRTDREDPDGRFFVEAQITGQLEHPGIVPIYDLGVDENGRPFYVMGFVRGATLRQAIEEYHSDANAQGDCADVKLCRLLEIFVRICETVAFAHSRG